MKRKILIIFVGICILFPCPARADNQLFRNVKLIIMNVQEEANKVIKYYELAQHIMQEVSRAREVLKNLRTNALAYLKAQAMALAGSLLNELAQQGIQFLNTRMGSFSIPGIAENLKFGDVVQVGLEATLGSKYLKQTSSDNDIQEAISLDIRNNNLRVENAARMFANALVNRYNLQSKIQENPKDTANGESSENSANPEDLCNGSMDDLPTVMDCYAQLNRTANHRWVNIIASMSEYNDLSAQSQITLLPAENVVEVLGIAEEDVGVGGSLATLRKFKNATVGVVKNLKSGNFMGALGTAANFAGENLAIKNLSSITAGINASIGVFNGISTGNWGAALAAAGTGAGNIIGLQGNTAVADILINTAGYAGSAVTAVQHGDWGGALSAAATGAGAGLAVSGKGTSADIIGSVASYAGGAVNAIKNGDYTGALATLSAGAGAGLAAGGLETSAGIVTNAGYAAATAARTVQTGIENGDKIWEIGKQLATDPSLIQAATNTAVIADSSYQKVKAQKAAAAHMEELANAIAATDNEEVKKYANMSRNEYNSNKDKVETLRQTLHKQMDNPDATEEEKASAWKDLDALAAIDEVKANEPTIEEKIRATSPESESVASSSGNNNSSQSGQQTSSGGESASQNGSTPKPQSTAPTGSENASKGSSVSLEEQKLLNTASFDTRAYTSSISKMSSSELNEEMAKARALMNERKEYKAEKKDGNNWEPDAQQRKDWQDADVKYYLLLKAAQEKGQKTGQQPNSTPNGL